MIHVLTAVPRGKTWMAGTSHVLGPSMTKEMLMLAVILPDVTQKARQARRA